MALPSPSGSERLVFKGGSSRSPSWTGAIGPTIASSPVHGFFFFFFFFRGTAVHFVDEMRADESVAAEYQSPHTPYWSRKCSTPTPRTSNSRS